jgi:hypothetical protein
MNILNASPSSNVRPQTNLAKKAETSPETATAEPKESFSLTRTLSTGLLGFMGRRIPSTMPEVSPEKMDELREKIKPGDVLMSADLSYPGWSRMEYWAIGSHYTHAALAGSDGFVYEAVGEGVIKTTLNEFLEGRKKIAVARPGLDEKQAETATEYAKSHLGKPYDGVFNFGSDDEFYCSELVAKSIKAADVNKAAPMGKIFGKDAVSPDVWRKTPGIEVIHDDKSNYWTNKLDYWPIAASTAALATAGHFLGGITGAVVGAGTGFVGSILVGNKIQTGHFSPSLVEIKAGKH